MVFNWRPIQRRKRLFQSLPPDRLCSALQCRGSLEPERDEDNSEACAWHPAASALRSAPSPALGRRRAQRWVSGGCDRGSARWTGLVRLVSFCFCFVSFLIGFLLFCLSSTVLRISEGRRNKSLVFCYFKRKPSYLYHISSHTLKYIYMVYFQYFLN